MFDVCGALFGAFRCYCCWFFVRLLGVVSGNMKRFIHQLRSVPHARNRRLSSFMFVPTAGKPKCFGVLLSACNVFDVPHASSGFLRVRVWGGVCACVLAFDVNWTHHAFECSRVGWGWVAWVAVLQTPLLLSIYFGVFGFLKCLWCFRVYDVIPWKVWSEAQLRIWWSMKVQVCGRAWERSFACNAA